jgi:hypothetical protein
MIVEDRHYKILAGMAVAVFLTFQAFSAGAQAPPSPAAGPAPAAAATPARPSTPAVGLPAPSSPQGQAAGASAPAVSPADAAADPMQDAQMRVTIQQSYEFRTKLRAPEIMPQEFGTVFFTLWQHALLEEAKRGFLTRRPTKSEVANSGSAVPGERPRSIREISLGGIVYRQPQDWTIWLNGQRVTPDALPDQVLDLKVGEDHIDLKWFDTFSNLIFPIRLRSHQRFNLDARIFLPGAGTRTP